MEILMIVKDAFAVTVFVLSMMLILEYITVQSKGRFNSLMRDNKRNQIITAAVLGIIPGCLGTYAVVSMFIHGTVAFPALVTALIASSGDEAFIMFSQIPEEAVYITASLFVISIITGYVTGLFTKNIAKPIEKGHKMFHEEKECICFEKTNILTQLKNIVPERLISLIFQVAFIAFMIIVKSLHSDEHPEEHNGHEHGEWLRITFMLIISIVIFITLTTPDHFIKEHLWKHIIKKHLLKVFLWVAGTFIIVHLLNENINLKEIVSKNQIIILLLAVAIGIIPGSGPHIVFISLFISGTIPLSILLANSIVQDGHGSIPLLAESKKTFVKAKLINILVGLIIGFIMLVSGY